MGNSVTQRDRIWTAAIDRLLTPGTARFRLHQVDRDLRIDLDDPPSRETVRRTLAAMTDLGVLKHRKGSEWYLAGDVLKQGRRP